MLPGSQGCWMPAAEHLAHLCHALCFVEHEVGQPTHRPAAGSEHGRILGEDECASKGCSLLMQVSDAHAPLQAWHMQAARYLRLLLLLNLRHQ